MYAPAVQDLIDELGRLPGVGPRSAQRIAFYLLKAPSEDARRLSVAIDAVKARVSWCRRCFNIAESELPGVEAPDTTECGICSDGRRDPTVVCVVEEPKDLVAVERTGNFHGRYHVLQGTISPLDGIGPDHLRMRELVARVGSEGITEIILCFTPTIEADATALYLTGLLQHLPVRLTRVASGLPVGGDLEYADELTLGRALSGRREVGA
jgi:recombination protein RecR